MIKPKINRLINLKKMQQEMQRMRKKREMMMKLKDSIKQKKLKPGGKKPNLFVRKHTHTHTQKSNPERKKKKIHTSSLHFPFFFTLAACL